VCSLPSPPYTLPWESGGRIGSVARWHLLSCVDTGVPTHRELRGGMLRSRMSCAKAGLSFVGVDRTATSLYGLWPGRRTGDLRTLEHDFAQAFAEPRFAEKLCMGGELLDGESCR